MVAPAIHRVIERHAAAQGDAIAILGDRQSILYRDLNQRANLVARRLHVAGFRRGSHALVCMPRGVDLGVLLLAVLKAGGSYAWEESGEWRIAIMPTPAGVRHSLTAIDARALVQGEATTCPNLPILTRGTDIACVLRDRHGTPVTLVPHATVTSLLGQKLPSSPLWNGDSGALDLWLVLMAGNTIVVESEPAAAAA